MKIVIFIKNIFLIITLSLILNSCSNEDNTNKNSINNKLLKEVSTYNIIKDAKYWENFRKNIFQLKCDSFDEIKLKAKNGDLDAQYILGLGYHKGGSWDLCSDPLIETRIPFNEENAFYWLNTSAQSGHPLAQYYLSTNTVFPNTKFWLKESAKQGLPEAQFKLAIKYYNDDFFSFLDIQSENIEAISWLRKAAENLDFKAIIFLGELFEYGKIVPRNYVYSYVLYNELYKYYPNIGKERLTNLKLKPGFSKKVYLYSKEINLSDIYNYIDNKIIKKNIDINESKRKIKSKDLFNIIYKSRKFLYKDIVEELEKKAFTENDIESYFWLSIAKIYGEGVDRNIKQGISYLKIAAENGHLNAQYLLGILYIKGSIYLKKNKDEGFKWLKLASDQGHSHAQLVLAIELIPEPQNDNTNQLIKNLLLKSAKVEVDALTLIGLLHISDKRSIFQNNPEKGFDILIESAKKGSKFAQYMLALETNKKNGYENKVISYVLINNSASTSKKTSEIRDKYEKEFTSDLIFDAQQRDISDILLNIKNPYKNNS